MTDSSEKTKQTQGESDAELAPMDFGVLVLSLRASAMMHLGQGEDDSGVPLPVDLPLARHSIALLRVLEEKTQGNLTGEEERLLSQVLFDLRTEYVAIAKRQGR